ncbi:MAG: hypothetical protein R2770_04125 [Acidimicrobiales bacterium]
MSTVLESGFRSDLVEAHETAAGLIAASGPWWSGVQRLAMLAEVRRARAHSDLPPWQAPSSAEGLAGSDDTLPPAAVDAIWRISNHPGTLTRAWYDAIVAGLPSPEHYVELVAVTAAVNSLDRFAEIMDLELLAPGQADQRPPSHDRVEGAEVTSHWVPTVPIRGANVQKALSGVAGGRDLWAVLTRAQYVPPEALMGDLEWNRGTLDRRQIELIAAMTSIKNDCFY